MRILIAEDDDLFRVLLADYVAELGHEVKSAAGAMQLVELALAECPDLVITDLHMPGMSGGSMISMLDMYPGLSGIPVIVVSGATPGELEAMGIPEGIPVLSKPLNFAALAAELGRVQKRPAMRRNARSALDAPGL